MQIKRIIAGLLSVSLVFSSAIAFVSAEAKLPGTDVVEAFNPDNTFIISEDLTEDYYEINTYEGNIIHIDIQLDPEVYDLKTFEYSSADKKTIITYDKNLICTESGEDTVYISIYSKSLLKHRQFTLKINILPDDSIPDEIRGKIEKLNESEHSDFQRKKLELLGALDVDVPRINMDIITEFIETSDNFFEIGDKINNLTKVPDVKINGELTFYSYWFDDKGTEEIAVGYDYPCSIYYYKINDDGKRTIVQDLYPVKKDPVEIDQTDYDYILYKNIFGDGINYGDINFDDTVDLSDLTMMSQYILKDIELTASQIKCADVNADDEVNVQDLALLKQFVMKDDVKLGVSKGGVNDTVTLVNIVDTAARDGIPTDDSLEEFYKDGEYTYAFPSIESDYIECIFSDTSKIKIKYALEHGLVSVDDLKTYNIMYWIIDSEGNMISSRDSQVDETSFDLQVVSDIRRNTSDHEDKWKGFIAGSVNELEDIIKINEGYSEEDTSIAEIIDNDFFSDKSLVVIYSICSAGNSYSIINDLSVNGTCIDVSTLTNAPSVATPDMVYRRYIYFADKNAVKDIDSFNFKDKLYDDIEINGYEWFHGWADKK